MSEHSHHKYTPDEIIENLDEVLSHLAKVQDAISEASDSPVASRDMKPLQELITAYKAPHNASWAKNGPNASIIETIVCAFDQISKPIKSDFESDANNLQIVVDNLQILKDMVERFGMLDNVLEHLYSIQDSVREGGHPPIHDSDVHPIYTMVHWFNKPANAAWSKTGDYAQFIEPIITAFSKLSKNKLGRTHIKSNYKPDERNLQIIIDNVIALMQSGAQYKKSA